MSRSMACLDFHERALVAPLKPATAQYCTYPEMNFHERALVAPLKHIKALSNPVDDNISTSARSWPH